MAPSKIYRCWQIMLLSVATILLLSCCEGYRLDPACINITGISEQTKSELLSSVSRFLDQEGFKDFGKYQEMIALVQENQSMPAASREEELARLERERIFLNDTLHLRIVWADYSNATPADLRLIGYKPPSDHFIELNIYEERPGGFSPNGVQFYRRFLNALRAQFGPSVIVVKEPPPTDASEYQRITRANTIAAIVGWFISALVGLLITTFPSIYLLKRLKLSTTARRLAFALVNTWLVAPLPFQGGYIFVFPGPNLLAFPWTDGHYYSSVASYASISFPCALLLCASASMYWFKRPIDADSVTA